jgi:uncharacterized protein YecA (UPF0149 family)
MEKQIDPRPFRERMEAVGCKFERVANGFLVSKEGYTTQLITPFDRFSTAKWITEYFENELPNSRK